MIKKRQQLTLFVPASEETQNIDYVRKTYNLEQYNIIKSHVTLCREDELLDMEKVFYNINFLVKSLQKNNENMGKIPIFFDKITRFSAQKGVMLTAKDENVIFHQIRTMILSDIVPTLRLHNPHLTLIHPRNGTCTDIIFKEIRKINFPSVLYFNKISLIEQEITTDFSKKWDIVEEFEL